jgi:predicted DNA-binding protein (UPF0251 family)
MGEPCADLERVVLAADEVEALRLADLTGLYHEAAAESMGISRVTFGRILSRARATVAEALIEGKVLLIGEGPTVDTDPRESGIGCPIHRRGRRRGRGCRCGGAGGRRRDLDT